MNKRYFGPWAVTECDGCGFEFQVTRTNPKKVYGEVLCDECEAYNRGVNDAIQPQVWIRVSDRLPNIRPVLVTYLYGVAEASFIDEDFYICNTIVPEVTHWMPLPEPPEDK